jgi:hypothetical protein
MSKPWFKPIGWIYYPVSIIGWLIVIFTVILMIHDFLAVDRRSHSISDTYYGFVPYGGLYFLIYLWIASKTTIKK